MTQHANTREEESISVHFPSLLPCFPPYISIYIRLSPSILRNFLANTTIDPFNIHSADTSEVLPAKFGGRTILFSSEFIPMEEEGQECRQEEDTLPVFKSFVTENDGGSQAEQQHCGTIPSILTDTVSHAAIREAKSRAEGMGLDWQTLVEQVEAILQPSLTAAETKVTLAMQQFVESIESQILSALKQAAMDIIEHLGKEAAMRVLVAERKAANFEKELINAKQEALTMLLRLKHSMDSQITNAERACVIERRRTQDVEAKLITAQDTLKKLKAELKRKGEVLEKMQKLAHPLDEHHFDQMHSPTEDSSKRKHGNRVKASDNFPKDLLLEAESSLLLAVNNASDSHNNIVQSAPIPMFAHMISPSMQLTSSTIPSPEQVPLRKPTLPSIITKSKEQQIYGNGYNQDESKECLSTEYDLLPQSVEQRQPGTTLSPIGQNDKLMSTAAKLTKECNAQGKQQCALTSMPHPCPKFENTQVDIDFEERNSLQEQKDGGFSHINARFATPRGRSGLVDRASLHMQDETSPNSESNASLNIGGKLGLTDIATDGARSIENQEDQASPAKRYTSIFLPEDREAGVGGAEYSEASGKDGKPASSRREILGMPFEAKLSTVVQPEFGRNVEENSLPGTDYRTYSNPPVKDGMGVQSTPSVSPGNLSEENGSINSDTTDNRKAGVGGVIRGTVQIDGEKARLSVDSDSTRQECEVAVVVGQFSATESSKNSNDQARGVDGGQDAETHMSASVSAREVHRRPARDTILTFRRKRKGEALFVQNGNSGQEVKDPKIGNKQYESFPDSLCGKLPQKQRTSSLASQMSNLAVESSRDSRRLMQGARQLISLSEKKWC